jgi:uncharacterized protein YjiS (DUF1127 family)
MSTIYAPVGSSPSATLLQRVLGPLKQHWQAFLVRRLRQQLRNRLDDLSDRELKDIGIARGEIDYVAGTTDLDPRF